MKLLKGFQWNISSFKKITNEKLFVSRTPYDILVINLLITFLD